MTMPDTQTNNAIKTVNFKTVGCKLNQSETDVIGQQFTTKGYELKKFGDEVDLTIINTCSVTNAADRDCRALIRQAIKTSPKARIVVTGCYAQVAPQDIKKIAGVDLILGNQEKFKIFDYLKSIEAKLVDEPLVYVNERGKITTTSDPETIASTSRSRAFLKVQDGCDYFCTYCIVPFARGRARSVPYADILHEAHGLADKGFKEIVLTGVNIGTYHDTEQNKSLTDLMRALQQIKGLERMRLSSIEPNLVTNEMIDLFKTSSVICPHFHIPLQSGDNATLASMHRKYSIEDFASLVTRIRKDLPLAAIGTDVIVGFPGETDEQFEDTMHFIIDEQLAYLHIFSYSPRKGTAAAHSSQQVSVATIKKRSRILHEVGTKLRLDYYKNFIGKTVSVHFDQTKGENILGYSENYIRVAVPYKNIKRGNIMPVRLTGLDTGKIICTGAL